MGLAMSIQQPAYTANGSYIGRSILEQSHRYSIDELWTCRPLHISVGKTGVM
jgi:hypothetical protein